jgi:hypothetical protein
MEHIKIVFNNLYKNLIENSNLDDNFMLWGKSFLLVLGVESGYSFLNEDSIHFIWKLVSILVLTPLAYFITKFLKEKFPIKEKK